MYKYSIYPQIIQNSTLPNQNSSNEIAYDAIKFTQTQIQNFEKYANNYGYREAQKVAAINNQAELKDKGSIVFNVREEFIFNFLFSQLVTLQHRSHINQTKQFSLIMNGREIFTQRKSENKLFEIENFSYKPLFQKLSIQNIIDLIQGILLEKQIVIFSKNPSEVIHLCEALFTFIRPLTWKCLYIPFLPTQMLETLHIMVPYIIGVHRNNKDSILSQVDSENKIFLDLDSDYIIQDGIQLPEDLKLQLREQLREKLKTYKDSLKQGSKSQQNLNFMNLILNMKKIFFHFMISLINNYLQFFLFPTDFNYERNISNEIFDFKAYFRFLGANQQSFYQEFSQKTMIFRSFIEETYKVLRQVEVFNRDIKEIREEEAPPFLVEFIKEIQKVNSYIQLKSQQRIEVTNVNIYKYPALLHTLNLEHNIIINNYMQELSKQNYIETKNELLKYLIYFQKDIKKKSNQSPFYPQSIRTMVVPYSPIIEEIQQIPIINLDEIQNDVDKTISRRSEQSKLFISPKQPYISDTELPQQFYQQFDVLNQYQEVIDFDDQNNRNQIPQLVKQINIKQDFENNKRCSLNIQECSTNELIIPYPSPHRNPMQQINNSLISREQNQIGSQQRLYSEQNVSMERKNYYGNSINGQNVFVKSSISQAGGRWNRLEQNNNTVTTSSSLKRNTRKIFENTIQQFSGNQSAIGSRATIGPNQQKRYSNNVRQKAKTELSIEDRHDIFDENCQILNNPHQINEDTLGEDAQDEDFKFFKIEDISNKYNKKEKSLSPNRSDIPDENQVDTVPDFFRGELEMKNIVTLNIDQITSCHTFRKKELNQVDKSTHKHFTSVQTQNGNSTVNTQRSQKYAHLAFTSIAENEFDNEYNHINTCEEEADVDPLLEIRNHFFQEQLSPAHLGSICSNQPPFPIMSPTSGGNYMPSFKGRYSQQDYKINRMSGVGSENGMYATQNSLQNSNIQQFINSRQTLTEDNIDSREIIPINTRTSLQGILQQGGIHTNKWKQNGIQINTQTTINEEDNCFNIKPTEIQISSQGVCSPTSRIFSPQAGNIQKKQNIFQQQGGKQMNSSTQQPLSISSYRNVTVMKQSMKNNYFHTNNVMEEENENLSTEPRDKPPQIQHPSKMIFNNSSQYNQCEIPKQKQIESNQHVITEHRNIALSQIEYNDNIKHENNQIRDDPVILKDFFSYDIKKNGQINKQNNFNQDQPQSQGIQKNSEDFPQKEQQTTTNQKNGVKCVNNSQNSSQGKKGYHKRRGNNSSINISMQSQSNRSQSYLNSQKYNIPSNVINHKKQISQTNRDYNQQTSQQAIEDNKRKQKIKIFDPSQSELNSSSHNKTYENECKNSFSKNNDTYSRNQQLIQKNIRTILQTTQREQYGKMTKEQQNQTTEKLIIQPLSCVLQTQPCESIPTKNSQSNGKESISSLLNQRRQSKDQQLPTQKSKVVQIVFGGENKQNQVNHTNQYNCQNTYFPTQQAEKQPKPTANTTMTSKTSTIKSLSSQNFFLSKNSQYKQTANQNNTQNNKQQLNSKRIF